MTGLLLCVYRRLFRRYTRPRERWQIREDPDELGYWVERVGEEGNDDR